MKNTLLTTVFCLGLIGSTSLSAETMTEEIEAVEPISQESFMLINSVFTPKNSYKEHAQLFLVDATHYRNTVENYLTTHVAGDFGSLSHALHAFFTDVKLGLDTFLPKAKALIESSSFDTQAFDSLIEKESVMPLIKQLFSKSIVVTAQPLVAAGANPEALRDELATTYLKLAETTDSEIASNLFTESLHKLGSVAAVEAHRAAESVAILESTDYGNIPQEGVVVVDYYADWCGPCRTMLPRFASVASSMKEGVQFFKCEANQDVFKGLNISTIPCIVLYKDGVEIKRTGSLSEEALTAWIAEAL